MHYYANKLGYALRLSEGSIESSKDCMQSSKQLQVVPIRGGAFN